MSFKKVLALLLAVCMLIPMAACGEKKDPNTDGSVTTTVQQAEVTDGDGEADPNGETTTNGEETEITDENGETVTTEEGETTTNGEETEVTDENGETVTTEVGETTTTTQGEGKITTTKKDSKTTTTKNEGKITTTKKDSATTTKKTTVKTTGKTTNVRTTVKRTVATTTRKGNTAVGAEVTLKTGTTRADAGVNFGGKTFLLASPNTGSKPSDFTQGGFDIFKQKYNGIMKQDGLGTADYVSKVAGQQAGGKVYDVLFMQMSNYPALFVADCAVPVTDYITTADLWKNGTEGGFSEAVMQDYSWKGEAYAMGGSYSQVPYAVFYNKKSLKTMV